jgi:hypothetical protein
MAASLRRNPFIGSAMGGFKTILRTVVSMNFCSPVPSNIASHKYTLFATDESNSAFPQAGELCNNSQTPFTIYNVLGVGQEKIN